MYDYGIVEYDGVVCFNSIVRFYVYVFKMDMEGAEYDVISDLVIFGVQIG